METSGSSSARSKGNGSNIEKGAAAAHDVIDKAADAVVSKVAASAHRGIDNVASVAAPAAGWIDQTAGKVAQKRQEIVEGSIEYVRSKPLATVVTVLAIGFLLGRLMR